MNHGHGAEHCDLSMTGMTRHACMSLHRPESDSVSFLVLHRDLLYSSPSLTRQSIFHSRTDVRVRHTAFILQSGAWVNCGGSYLCFVGVQTSIPEIKIKIKINKLMIIFALGAVFVLHPSTEVEARRMEAPLSLSRSSSPIPYVG